jgi:hexosaminidase
MALVALLLGASVWGASAPRVHGLMPVPTAVKFQQGRVPITAEFSVAVRGHTDRRLDGALQRMLRRLEGRTGLTLSRALAEPEKATLVLEVSVE